MATASSGKTPKRTFAVVVAAGVLTVSGIGYATASEVTSKVKHTEVFGLVNKRVANDGGENILLVGSDDRTGLSKKERKKLHVGQNDYGRHTDSMMIMHIANDGSIGIVSIPRDSYTQIPAFTDAKGNTTAAVKEKINAAYSIGGPSLAVETVELATGVHIDHYAEINFGGFVKMVDGLGGVPVCTKTAIDDEKSNLHLPAGTTELNGTQALAYVRARYFDPSADIGRMKRQQAFLGSVFKTAMGPSVALNPPRLIGFLNAAAESVTTDEQMNKQAMWTLMSRMRGVSPSSISFQTVPLADDAAVAAAGGASGDVVWDPEKSAELFAKLKTGDALTDAPKAKSKVKTVEVAPSSISVTVRNGSDVSGLGTKASTDLAGLGFSVTGQAQNAANRNYSNTVIEYDPRYDTSVKTLQAALPGSELKQVDNLGHTFRVIVGSDYKGAANVSVAGGTASSAPSASDKPKTAADDLCAG